MTRTFLHCIALALACTAGAAQAALVEADFEISRFSASFAEHSSLAVSGGFTTWQGGVVRWGIGGQPQGEIALPLAGGLQPWVVTSPTGIQHSAVLPHELLAPAGTEGVIFADRYGWRTADGQFFYPAWDTSPSRDNYIAFNAAPATEVAEGDVFRLGTFSVRNGSWHSASNGGAPVRIDFSITLRSADAWFDGLTVSDSFIYQALVAPGGTPEQNADMFWLAGRPDLGSVRVLEQGLATFDLYGRIGSLTLARMDGVTGAAFLAPVPEPAPWLLLAAGLIALRLRDRARALPAR